MLKWSSRLENSVRWRQVSSWLFWDNFIKPQATGVVVSSMNRKLSRATSKRQTECGCESAKSFPSWEQVKDKIGSRRSMRVTSVPFTKFHMITHDLLSIQSVSILVLSSENRLKEKAQVHEGKRVSFSPFTLYTWLRFPGNMNLPLGWKTTER